MGAAQRGGRRRDLCDAAARICAYLDVEGPDHAVHAHGWQCSSLSGTKMKRHQRHPGGFRAHRPS
jgi:hypothetical protein